MDSATLATVEKTSWFAAHWRKLVWLLILLLLAAVVAGLWPQNVAMGETGTQADGAQVQGLIAVVDSLNPGQPYGPFEFSEKGLNAYLDYYKMEKMRTDYIRVSIREGHFAVRLIRTVTRIGNMPVRMSYDVDCWPEGAAVQVGQVKCGRLAMFGPFRGMALRKVKDSLAAEKEWGAVKYIMDIKAAPGKISLVLKK
jgi:hypothetical protein